MTSLLKLGITFGLDCTLHLAITCLCNFLTHKVGSQHPVKHAFKWKVVAPHPKLGTSVDRLLMLIKFPPTWRKAGKLNNKNTGMHSNRAKINFRQFMQKQLCIM